MSRELQDKKCIVTGGGTGIGRAIAVALASRGAAVAVTGRRKEKLDETVALVGEHGGEGLAESLDVRDRTAVDRVFGALAERLGGLDVLVNNAGLGGPNGCVDDGPDRWDEIVRTNLDGTFFCTRAAVPHMGEGGRIVNVPSVLGRFGVPGYTAYCASKAGVIGFTRALALEVAPKGMTANAIVPGWVETQMARDGLELMAEGMGTTYEKARAEAMGAVPVGRIIEPDEIAGLVCYLVGPGTGALTGQAIALCGGATMV